jgi:hypothetical protein
VTNFERLTQMTPNELATAAVDEFHGSLLGPVLSISLLDLTVHANRERCIKHNLEWLNKEIPASS